MKRSVILISLLAAGFCAAAASSTLLADEIEGRYKIIRISGAGGPVTGMVTELPNAYLVEVRKGIKIKIPKNQVKELIALDDVRQGRKVVVRPHQISDEQIREVLGSENIVIGALTGMDDGDPMQELPIDQQSVDEMMRMADTAASKAHSFLTDHFVFVYTSDIDQARKLASRLERVYEWCMLYCTQLQIPLKVPDAKLEIFYFGTHAEYIAYQSLAGFSDQSALGFYMPPSNRSAFFDMSTYPPAARRIELASNTGISGQERRKAKNEVERWADITNLKIVQHEAAHHIHFNVGIFPKGADLPRWAVEGLATMFEVPPTVAGGALGAINHSRLAEFREFYGIEGKTVGMKWEYVRTFILSDKMRNPYEVYVMGWGLNHYLRRKHRDQYAEWTQLLADREDDWGVRVEQTEKAGQFEEIFGEIDEEWVDDFTSYIAQIVYRPSLNFRMSLP